MTVDWQFREKSEFSRVSCPDRQNGFHRFVVLRRERDVIRRHRDTAQVTGRSTKRSRLTGLNVSSVSFDPKVHTTRMHCEFSPPVSRADGFDTMGV